MIYRFRSYFLAFLCYLTLIFLTTKPSFLAVDSSSNSNEIARITIQAAQISNNSKIENSLVQKPKLSSEKFHEQKADFFKKTESLQEHQHLSSYTDAKKLIFSPLPEIPEEMRYEAFNSLIIARFVIGFDGSVLRVELVQAASNPRLNNLLIKSLKKWVFSPTGKEEIFEVRVNFRVE